MLGIPSEQVFWYTKTGRKINPLTSTITADAVVVGGGFAGFSAALSFAQRGLKTVLLEQYQCGSGASGKSSGFITPDAELNLSRFEELYGDAAGQCIWKYIIRGVENIRSNIRAYDISCGYQEHDTLILANSKSRVKNLRREYQNRRYKGYSSTLYDNGQAVQAVIGSEHYYGGLQYGGTFSIDPHAYISGMHPVLLQNGVTIYEESPVIAVNADHVLTVNGRVNARYIIVCADRFIPFLGKLNNEIFQIQTHIMLSQPLSEKTIAQIFPDNPCMAWDTDLLYTYFRLTPDNRFLIGGGTYWHSYRTQESYHARGVYNKLSGYIKNKFPHLRLNFEYMWPGLIGISKNIAPIAGRDSKMPNVYYVSACAGLPIAATLGIYGAEHLIDGKNELDDYFKPERSSVLDIMTQKIIGKRTSFALHNLYTLLRY